MGQDGKEEMLCAQEETENRWVVLFPVLRALQDERRVEGDNRNWPH